MKQKNILEEIQKNKADYYESLHDISEAYIANLHYLIEQHFKE